MKRKTCITKVRTRFIYKEALTYSYKDIFAIYMLSYVFILKHNILGWPVGSTYEVGKPLIIVYQKQWCRSTHWGHYSSLFLTRLRYLKRLTSPLFSPLYIYLLKKGRIYKPKKGTMNIIHRSDKDFITLYTVPNVDSHRTKNKLFKNNIHYKGTILNILMFKSYISENKMIVYEALTLSSTYHY